MLLLLLRFVSVPTPPLGCKRFSSRTTMGQIAAAAGVKYAIAGPLTIEIEQFVKMTAIIATLTGVIFVILSMTLVNSDFLTQFVFFVGGEKYYYFLIPVTEN